MRLLVVAACLLMLLSVPAASQEPGMGAGVLADGDGDVRSEVQGTAGPAPPGVYASMDMVSLAVAESATEMAFTVTVADLRPASEETAVDGVRFEAQFAHNGRQFRLMFDHVLPTLDLAWLARLSMRDDGAAEWTQLWSSDVGARADPAADTITVALPRDLLADKDGASPFPGRTLDGIRMRSWAFLSNVSLFPGSATEARVPLQVVDDMPDAGQAPAAYPVQVGLAQTGHARLTSNVPYRASNGEATTFLLNATARNLSGGEDRFTFEAVGVPGRLSVTVPVTVASIPGGGSVDIPVLATVPFAHIHGGVDDFTLEMRSATDPGSVGRLAMGLRYLAVPQPAGHHDTLYVHSRTELAVAETVERAEGYLNTLEDDGSDSGQPFAAYGLSINGNNVTHTWAIALEPGLEMGLDFDLTRSGQLTLPVGSPALPLVAASLSAELATGRTSYYSGDGLVLARMAPTAPVDILPGSTHLFTGELAIDPAADRLPFEPGRNLVLFVALTTMTVSFIGEETPRIHPGGHMQLPLLEYHDPVDDALRFLDGPGLSPLGAQERLVNPGEAVVFPFALANAAGEERAYHVEVSGANMEWASLPSNHITVPAHGTASGSLIVRAPAGVGDGDRADLILQAYDVEQPTARGLLRLLAEVDTALDHPDDTAVAADLEKKESPGLPALTFVIAALVALAIRRRLGVPAKADGS